MDKRCISKLPRTTVSGMAYTVLGEGIPIIAIHGGPGTDHQLFRPYLDSLANTYKLIYFDLPGHGASRPPTDYSLSTMASTLDEILEAIGEQQAYLLGSSYGSFLSMAFTLAHPQKVKGLVLVGAAASYQFREDSLEIAQRRAACDMLAALELLWSGSVTSDESFHTSWRQIFPLYFHTLPQEKVHQLADRLTYSIDTRKAILPTLRGYDIRARLGEIRAPALVAVGEHDWITPMRQAEELTDRLRQSQLVVFNESGHYPFIEEQSKFNDIVKRWFDKVNEEGKA